MRLLLKCLPVEPRIFRRENARGTLYMCTHVHGYMCVGTCFSDRFLCDVWLGHYDLKFEESMEGLVSGGPLVALQDLEGEAFFESELCAVSKCCRLGVAVWSLTYLQNNKLFSERDTVRVRVL